MKNLFLLNLLLGVTIALSGCATSYNGLIPTTTQVQSTSPAPPLSTSTLRLQSTLETPQVSLAAIHSSTPTRTPINSIPATMEPEQVKEFIRATLREPEDCDSPCFWGIVPGQTTLDQAREILTHLGLVPKMTNSEELSHEQIDKLFSSGSYQFESGLDISYYLTFQNNIVTNIRLYIDPGIYVDFEPREWSAYSPETLFTLYGLPSRVGLWFDGGPRQTYYLTIFYDVLSFIMEYELEWSGSLDNICPLVDPVTDVSVWLGKNPENSPWGFVLLQEATEMTIEEFVQVMTGDPKNACINLKQEAFFP